MMQPGRLGRSDVHRRTFLDGLETLENLNLVRRVIVDVFAQSGGPCPPDALRGDPFAPLRWSDTMSVVAGGHLRRQRLFSLMFCPIGMMYAILNLNSEFRVSDSLWHDQLRIN